MDFKEPRSASALSTIVAIDGQPLVRWAIKQLIASDQSLHFAGEAQTIHQAMALVERVRPTLSIVGLDYADGTGFGLIRELRSNHPKMPTLVYATLEATMYAEHCLGLGARGYVSSSQSTDEMLDAIRQLLAGHLYLRSDRHRDVLSRVVSSGHDLASPLTARLSTGEIEVFHLVGSGLTNQEIASRLHRSVKTIETYRARIKSKLGLGNSVELAQFALRCLNSLNEGAARITSSTMC